MNISQKIKSSGELTLSIVVSRREGFFTAVIVGMDVEIVRRRAIMLRKKNQGWNK